MITSHCVQDGDDWTKFIGKVDFKIQRSLLFKNFSIILQTDDELMTKMDWIKEQ